MIEGSGLISKLSVLIAISDTEEAKKIEDAIKNETDLIIEDTINDGFLLSEKVKIAVPDIIILDYHLKNINVLEFVEEAVIRYPATATILVGFILNFILFGVPGLKSSAIGFLIGFGFFLIFYLFGGMGAGDVKLMGAVGALLGYPMIIQSLLFTALSGIVIILVLFFPALRYAIRTMNFSNIWSLRKVYIPYGLAISIGTLLTLAFNLNKII